MGNLILSEIEDGIATVTLNRPDQRNATSLELLEELDQTVATIEGDHRVRVMILAGAGEVFCAGMDLEQLTQGEDVVSRLLHKLSKVSRRIDHMRIPTIARVQGAAIGGGCTLMLVTDFAISHKDARIGYPPSAMNLSPAILAPWLIRRIGHGRARAMLLRSGSVSGEEAFRLGLVTDLVVEGLLVRTANNLANTLKQAEPEALAALKSLLVDLGTRMADETLDKAAQCSATVVAGEAAQTRLKGWLKDEEEEKKKAVEAAAGDGAEE